MPDWKNQLFFGDNLDILREHVDDESVDLVYLDPPFNSKATYNVLFEEHSGEESAAQIAVFEDTWHWSLESETIYHGLIEGSQALESLLNLMQAFRAFLGTSDMMAYLTMMAPRLQELHRVLKPTGSLYLHCDTTASHYLKLLLDAIFSPQNFMNEIIWKRTSGHSDARRFGNVHDAILFYRKGDNPTWNESYQKYDPDYVEQYYRYKDTDGRRWMSGDLGAAGLQGGGYDYEWKGVRRIWRVPIETMERLDSEGKIYYTKNKIPRIKRYLDESKGLPMQDVWGDVEALRSWHQEKLGYPTQKPEGLLERIIIASSNEGDIVLDPFCGCGTTISVAERLHRKWIGIDVTHLAMSLIRHRLHDTFGNELAPFEVIGDPKDLAGAGELAQVDRYQFQWWAVGMVDGRPAQDKKKGKDTGIDGYIYFFDDSREKAKQIIISVKSGHVSVKDIRDLKGVLDREKAAIGVFITLEQPTRDMKTEAVASGFYEPVFFKESKYPKVQILTIQEILEGKKVMYPQAQTGIATFKKAQRKTKKKEAQEGLF